MTRNTNVSPVIIVGWAAIAATVGVTEDRARVFARRTNDALPVTIPKGSRSIPTAIESALRDWADRNGVVRSKGGGA